MTLQLGDAAPDFTADTTEGTISLHDGFTTHKPYLRTTPQPNR